LHDYIKSNKTDPGLELLLRKFETLYPYLRHIASINKIKDPFDASVVEAYWLGNTLLETENTRNLHKFLIDDLGTKKKMGGRDFEHLENKLPRGAVPHHSFHVLNVWRQTGHNDLLDDLRRMDQCRISSGLVTEVSGPEITVTTEPLVYVSGKIMISPPISKKIFRSLEAEYDIEQIKVGQIVSIHWGVPCEIITEHQANILKKYTQKSIDFANQTS
jgi:hypothetical protein